MSRIGIVGANGAGKSTLMRSISESGGQVGTDTVTASPPPRQHHNLRCAAVAQQHHEKFAQHLKSSAAQMLMMESQGDRKTNISVTAGLTEGAARQVLGGFGLGGALALAPIRTLSGGQKAHLSMAIACQQGPHIVCLDEPTNHLDLESVDALAEGLRE